MELTKISALARGGSTPKTKKAKEHDVKRMFMFIRLSQALCAAWIVVASFAREPIGLLREDNTIQIRETVIATNPLHFVCLGISRISAYSMYPAMVLVFLSKAKALQTWLEGTVLSMIIPFHDLHTVHEAMGHWIAVDVWIHALFHTIRWAEQDRLHLYWTTDTGRSGFVVLAITPFITFPMMFEFFKKRMSFELRKTLHYLCIPFGIGIAFHAPAMHIGYVMGCVTAVYLADYGVRWLCMTHKIKSSQFVRLDAGIQLTFENPRQGFATNGGYILLNVPFVSRSEWHAFSVFAHPTLPDHSCVCVSKAGDWTSALHQAVQRPTVRPTWIQGPFPSPFKTTEDYDNLVLVAVGVGITPTMAALNRFKDDGRKYNLVWACRDASLIEFYAHSIARETSGWVMIYYTGSRPLQLGTDTQRLPPNVRIFRGRPDMQTVIAQLIGGVEGGNWLPEELLVCSETFFSKLTAIAKHVNDEQDCDAAVDKIRTILQGLLRLYSSQDTFDLLLHTFCNTDSDRDTLDLPALADFFRSMVSPLQHPRAEERAFIALFDPLNTGSVSDEAFRLGVERLVAGVELPVHQRGFSGQFSNPTSPVSPSFNHMRLGGFSIPPVVEHGKNENCVTPEDHSNPTPNGGCSPVSQTTPRLITADFVRVDSEIGKILQEDLLRQPAGLRLDRPSDSHGVSPLRIPSRTAKAPSDTVIQIAPPIWASLPPQPNLKFELTRVATQRLRRGSSSLEASSVPQNALLPVFQCTDSQSRSGRGKSSLAFSDAPAIRTDFIQHLRACRSAAAGGISAEFLKRNRSIQEEVMLQKETRDTWQILFCGGPSASLRNAMHEVARNLGVSLRTETFDW